MSDTRFAFGQNWQRFLTTIDERRIAEAEHSLAGLLGWKRLDGRSFLDAGSGSGLSSLIAIRMGATRVHSFDYDADSVACTAELRRRYFPAVEHWTVGRGDATDSAYVSSLGSFDVVYSWGVLHHTGAMWQGMANACAAVAPGGRLFVALYNDQGPISHMWRWVKRTYVRVPALRPLLIAVFGLYFELRTLVGAFARRHPGDWVRVWREPRERGMSRWHDLIDWVGGYPFEVASPKVVRGWCSEQGFKLIAERTVGRRLGCNEFVFERPSGS